jgi:hypothetical protein
MISKDGILTLSDDNESVWGKVSNFDNEDDFLNAVNRFINEEFNVQATANLKYGDVDICP